jgi:transcriptional regulator with XRE-family HTH domain
VDNVTFANRLKSEREAARLTQKELADRAGLSKAAVTHLEQGLREPTLATAQAIAKALGKPCSVFDEDSDSVSMNDELKRGRGRPPKPTADKPTEPKKPRGRPRKE